MKEQILQLRSEGKSYSEIKNILGCAKSTVAYYCGDKQKEASRKRGDDWKKKNPLKLKIEAARQRLRKRIQDFKRRIDYKSGNGINAGEVNSNISREEMKLLIKKFEAKPFCYLTGRKIDLADGNSYHLDHIIPVSKGGSNSLDNLGLACREANIGKGDLSYESFLNLCMDTLIHHGFSIKKD